MSLKCFFGFHDYKPVGMYWVWGKDPEYKHIKFSSINVMQEYECSRCGGLHVELIQSYPIRSFNQGKILKFLETRKIPHKIDYVNKKRNTLVQSSKGRND